MPFPQAIADLYCRLNPLGFSSQFIKDVILPDWWDDACAEVPYNRALAEAAIARHLGLSLEALRDKSKALSLSGLGDVCLKTATIGTTFAQVSPSILIAKRTAALLSRSVQCPFNTLPQSAALEIREEILKTSETVDLGSLLKYCWSQGIIVAHLARLPKARGFRKFDGVAMFATERPCILLGDHKDAPAKLVFFLAHELGHLLLGHAKPNSSFIFDDNLERVMNDEDESAANQFACELLTGNKEPRLRAIYGLRAEDLAKAVKNYRQSHRIDPGVMACLYGYCADRWPVAMKCLNILGIHTGGKAMIARELEDRLDLDQLPDSDRRFLEAVMRLDVTVQ